MADPGRPPDPHAYDTTISFRADIRMLAELKKLCVDKEITFADGIRAALARYIEENGGKKVFEDD